MWSGLNYWRAASARVNRKTLINKPIRCFFIDFSTILDTCDFRIMLEIIVVTLYSMCDMLLSWDIILCTSNAGQSTSTADFRTRELHLFLKLIILYRLSLLSTYLHKIVTLIGQLHGGSKVHASVYFGHILCQDIRVDKALNWPTLEMHNALKKFTPYLIKVELGRINIERKPPSLFVCRVMWLSKDKYVIMA